VPNKKLLKLDKNTMKCAFIFYGILVKGYKILDPMDIIFVYIEGMLF
jgi:hypothetical protein